MATRLVVLNIGQANVNVNELVLKEILFLWYKKVLYNIFFYDIFSFLF